ncbi:hypothetical protein LWP59_18050 [Amycolatopsis acidiphila]|nr:hypothetical protein [Amycolatopsis acidiphila]UIJ63402.1 hypothetical protein LWP59_18050 [Amycolatopsis acidiphila]
MVEPPIGDRPGEAAGAGRRDETTLGRRVPQPHHPKRMARAVAEFISAG